MRSRGRRIHNKDQIEIRERGNQEDPSMWKKEKRTMKKKALRVGTTKRGTITGVLEGIHMMIGMSQRSTTTQSYPQFHSTERKSPVRKTILNGSRR